MIVFSFHALAREATELGESSPIPTAMHLWRALHTASLGSMAVVYNGILDFEKRPLLEEWLKINQIKALTVLYSDSLDPPMCGEKVARYMAASGGAHNVYIDTDPAIIKEVVSAGITSMLLADPTVVRPEWVTEKSIKSWDSLVSEITHQKLIKAQRNWGEMEDVQ